jgi:RND family efflux transporter MFP subunit
MSVQTARSLVGAGMPAVALALAVAACGESPEPVYEGPGVTVVSVATARLGELRDVLTASGTIVPAPAADLTIYAPEPAEIVEMPKAADELVTTGDLLVRFDIASVNQAIATADLDVIQAQTRLESARLELARQTDLHDRGLTPRNMYDAARLEFSAAQSNLTQAETRRSTVVEAQDRAVVRAPFSGVVAATWHQVGDTVRPDRTDPIMRVIDPTRVQASVQLPIGQLARVVPGQSAIVRAIAGDIDEPAVVASRSDVTDPTAPTGEVRLSFTQAATLPLDTPLSVEILLDRRVNALIVPTQAVARDDLGPYVMLAGSDGLAHRRDVRLGIATPQQAEILQGIEEGDQVILNGLAEVEDQSPIAIGR